MNDSEDSPSTTGNPYAAPKAVTTHIEPAPTPASPFFPTAIWKLVVLYTASLGIYTLYWFYQHWKRARNALSRPIMPFWRAVFYIFFTHSLFRLIHERALAGRIRVGWQASFLATIFVLIQIAERIVDRITAKAQTFSELDFVGLGLMFAGLFPLILVQNTVNQINGDPEGRLNDKLTGANVILIVIGIALWALFITTVFFPEVLSS